MNAFNSNIRHATSAQKNVHTSDTERFSTKNIWNGMITPKITDIHKGEQNIKAQIVGSNTNFQPIGIMTMDGKYTITGYYGHKPDIIVIIMKPFAAADGKKLRHTDKGNARGIINRVHKRATDLGVPLYCIIDESVTDSDIVRIKQEYTKRHLEREQYIAECDKNRMKYHEESLYNYPLSEDTDIHEIIKAEIKSMADIAEKLGIPHFKTSCGDPWKGIVERYIDAKKSTPKLGGHTDINEVNYLFD